MADRAHGVEDASIPRLRQALRAALLRHRAEHAAGREAEDARAIGGRLVALLVEKHCPGNDAVADMRMRAAVAAALAAELEALEDDGR